MSDALFTQLLNLTVGAMLLTAVLTLWWRQLSSIIVIFGLQGIALAATVALIATHEGSAELGVVAVLVLVLRAGVLPWLLRRTLAAAGPNRRETRPLVNVVTSLLVIGHNPTMAYLAQLLDDGSGDEEAHREMAVGFPTSALAVFEVTQSWASLDLASARLVAFHAGRA